MGTGGPEDPEDANAGENRRDKGDKPKQSRADTGRPEIQLFSSSDSTPDIFTRTYAVDQDLLADDDTEARRTAKREFCRKLISILNNPADPADDTPLDAIEQDLEAVREGIDDLKQNQVANPTPVQGFLGFAELTNEQVLKLPAHLIRDPDSLSSATPRGANVEEVFALDKTAYFGYFRADSHPVLGKDNASLHKHGDSVNDNHTYWFITPDEELINSADGRGSRANWKPGGQNIIRHRKEKVFYYVTAPKELFPHYEGKSIHDRPVPEHAQHPPLPGTEGELDDIDQPSGRHIFAIIHQKINMSGELYDVLYLYTWIDILRLPPEIFFSLFEHSEQFTWFKEGLRDSLDMGSEGAAQLELMYFCTIYNIPRSAFTYSN